MEDTFSVRVDKVFGALSSSLSPSKPLASSLWSLTDEEVEKKEWIRDNETPDEADGPSLPDDVDGFFANSTVASDFKRPIDDVAGLKESGDVRGGGETDDVDEEWEIKNSIGMDCTLDFEEEEDKYDRVAVGDEDRSDRVYMREIHDYGVHVSSFDEIPKSFREASRDPRANHLAAMQRLKEDEEALKNPLEVSSEIEMSAHNDQSGSSDGRNHVKKRGSDEMVVGSQQDQSNACEAGKQVKSILKRKDDQGGSSSGKRVRFVPECKEDSNDGTAMVSLSNGEESLSVVQNSPAVPDYLRNPSKYTLYTFEQTDDLNEKSNQQGYIEFLNAVRKSKQVESDEPPVDLSQRVIFNPKKKARDAVMGNDDNKTERHKETAAQDMARKKSLPVSIEGEDIEESDVCAMEEDPPQMEANRVNSRNRTSRQYRPKITEELDDSAT